MAPPKSAPRTQPPDSQNDDSDTPATPDPHRELLQQLSEQLATANARLAALEAERQQPLADRLAKDPKIVPPPEFSGKISEYRNFIAQCTLTFTMCPNTYTDDEKKVLFIISRLRGTALSWAREIAENENHKLRKDYAAFKTTLSSIYLDQNYRELCENKLNALKQTKSAASYYVEFTTLSAPLELNDGALCLNFYRGLHDDVKDDMAIVGRASTYDALVKQAISLDQRRHQRRIETKSESGSSSRGQKQSRSPPNASNTPASNAPKQNIAPAKTVKPGTAKTSESKPHGPLSDEEKARRKRLNLCSYCADPKHGVADCPSVAAKEARVNTLSLPPPRYPAPTPSENSNTQAPTRTEA
jgi:Retrotransposon gag protein